MANVRARTRNPNLPPDDADDQVAARREQKIQARRADQAFEEVYQAGVKEGRAQTRARRARPGVRAATNARRRVGRGVSRPLRRAGRVSAAPITGSIFTVGRVVFGMLLIVALYLALSNATVAASFLDAIRKVFDWAGSPSTSIPYKA